MSIIPVITNPFLGKQEGFGEQYKILIYYMVYAELNNLKFLYSPFKEVAHNYDNDPYFLDKLENIVGLKGVLDVAMKDISNYESVAYIHHYIHTNMGEFEKSNSLQIIRDSFYKNKINPYSNSSDNSSDNICNVAIHIRRCNRDDVVSHSGLRVPDEIYIEIMKSIQLFQDNRIKIFHIFSQGEEENFKIYTELGLNIQLHINEPLDDTFMRMVYADILVVSPSALSYVAGVLSRNQVFYISHCNPPLPSWNIIQGYKSPRMYHKFTLAQPLCVYFDSEKGEYIIYKNMIGISPLRIVE